MTTWMFNWNGGGYNTVVADTKEEALELATTLGEPRTYTRNGEERTTKGLIPNPDTFRIVTVQEVMEEDARWAGMFY
jgi:hypothetical protein